MDAVLLEKLRLSERMLAHLEAQAKAAKVPKTKAALDSMARTQRVIVKARQTALEAVSYTSR
jgi:hypothetical protein